MHRPDRLTGIVDASNSIGRIGSVALIQLMHTMAHLLDFSMIFYLMVGSSMIQVNAHSGTPIGLQHDILFDGGLEHDSS